MELFTREGTAERKYLLIKGYEYISWGFGSGKEITTPIIFIGYGYKNDSLGYDDLKGTDVKGKPTRSMPRRFTDEMFWP